ncbi:MAG: tetratricopeptide repeat protein [Terriglobia bacterium]
MAVVLLWTGCNPASVAFQEGRKAEEQKDYDTAIIHFDQALKYQPENSQYLIGAKDARAKAAAAHFDRGRELLAQNRPDEAAAEFQKAVSLDPSNEAASQELRSILIEQSSAQQQRQSALRRAMEQEEQPETSGEVKLKALSQEPIAHLHLSADSRNVFETLGKLAGINVIFYYNFRPENISLDLSNVTILQALKAAADEANAFWEPVTSNTILVVPDSPTNRQELEPKVLKTVYLRNPSTTQNSSAMVTAVKQLMLQRGGVVMQAYEDPVTNSITLYDTPERVAKAVQIIHNLDRGKAEVLIQVSVIEADRDRLRDLGLAPVPLSGNTIAAVGLNPALGAVTPPGSTAAATPTLGLNRLGKLSTGDFSIALPGVIANALMSDQRTRILQNPEVRATAGEEATLTIGQSVPLATGSFGIPTAGAGSSTTGFGLLANTQFTYKDVGVVLKLTPYVAGNGDVILKSDVEISALGTPTNIGGIEQPTFTKRTVEHTIRVREGESSLLGGLIQTQTTNTVSGLPGLARIPFLKYFFSTTDIHTTDQEVMIMLTPHVIRLPDALEAENPPAPAVSAPAHPPSVLQPRGVQP